MSLSLMAAMFVCGITARGLHYIFYPDLNKYIFNPHFKYILVTFLKTYRYFLFFFSKFGFLFRFGFLVEKKLSVLIVS